MLRAVVYAKLIHQLIAILSELTIVDFFDDELGEMLQ